MASQSWLIEACHTQHIYSRYGFNVRILWEVGMIWIPMTGQPETYNTYRSLIRAVEYYLDHPKEVDKAYQKINRIQKELYMKGWVLPDLVSVVVHTAIKRGYTPPETWASAMMGKAERVMLL